jgi:hypothetical protein
MEEKEFKIRSIGKAQLAELYGVSKVTFNKWVRDDKLFPVKVYRRIKVFNPKQVGIIVEKFGPPA